MLAWLMLIVYVLLCSYVIWRTVHYLRVVHSAFKSFYSLLFISIFFVVLCATLIIGKLLPYSGFQRKFIWFSNLWVGFFIEFVFFTIVADIIVLIAKLIRRDMFKSLLDISLLRYGLGILVFALSIFFTTYGAIHSRHIVRNEMDVHLTKGFGQEKPLKVALISDLHMGYSVGVKRIEDMVDKVNAENPDIIVIAGDIFDNEYEALEDDRKLIEIFQRMKARLGVYGIYGNHDVKSLLIGGFTVSPVKEACRDPRFDEFMKEANVTMLEDESVLVDDSFYLVGRLDGERAGDGTDNRATIKELMDQIDHFDDTKPVIVLNHEPDDFDQAIQQKVDLMLSGHTHAGQFFPLTISTPFKWENEWGIYEKEGFINVTSCGVGVYGPDLRSFTNSEYMILNVY